MCAHATNTHAPYTTHPAATDVFTPCGTGVHWEALSWCWGWTGTCHTMPDRYERLLLCEQGGAASLAHSFFCVSRQLNPASLAHSYNSTHSRLHWRAVAASFSEPLEQTQASAEHHEVDCGMALKDRALF